MYATVYPSAHPWLVGPQAYCRRELLALSRFLQVRASRSHFVLSKLHTMVRSVQVYDESWVNYLEKRGAMRMHNVRGH